MARKYQKFGFRRDQNLSDAKSPSLILTNILNNLPTVSGETYDASDLYAVKGITNTNIDNNVLKSFAGITDLYTDSNNINRAINPIVTLKDRIDNFKVFTGDPLYGNGGDGLNATFIPSSLISTNITSSSIGSQLYNISNSEILYGPYRFWDNGYFKFDDKIYEEFTDTYGMIQWNGYFARRLSANPSNNFKFNTTGNILIEENITDPAPIGTIPDLSNPTTGWKTIKSIYSTDIPLTITGTGNSSVTLDVGSTNIIYLAIGQSITQHSGVKITDISDTVITLSSAITVPATPTVLNFTFDLGIDIIEIITNFSNTFENDKIRIRITLWWPIPNTIKIYNKYLSVDVRGAVNEQVSFSYFYQRNNRNYVENSQEAIGYFVENKLNPLKSETNNNLITTKDMLITYTPPLIFSDRVSYATAATTITSFDLGNLISTGNVFTNTTQGDYVIIRNATPTPLVYQVKEKTNNNNIFLNVLEKFAYAPQITLAKYSGLVGIFNVTAGVNSVISSLGGKVFDHRLISPDHIITGLQTINASAPFLRVKSYNKTSKAIVVTDLSGNTVSSVSGIVFIYQDKGVEDRSKDVFCNGVIGKLTNGVTTYNPSTTIATITLNDVDGISINMYAQFNSYIPVSAKITAVNTVAKTITIDKPILKTILDKSTIVISPDSVIREMCVIPLDTAFPFVGNEFGLSTQSQNSWISANQIQVDKLSIYFKLINGNEDTSKISTQSFAATLPYSKTLPIIQAGVTYKLLIL
jgi:hypothetical protein